MAAVSKPLANASSEQHLRPFNVRRDVKVVADLVELCFADTLDADGRRYLQHMRSTANNPGLLRLTSLTAGWASAPLSGYVWDQDGRVVGNASLIPYYLGRKRFYLIANVAVHPDYRRQGIARQLTERLIQRVRARGAPSVWLHVRDDNRAALELYTSLSFVERTRRTSWLSQGRVMVQEPPVGAHFASPRLEHWRSQRDWLRRAYPALYAWHLRIDANLLRPGLFGALWRLINNAQIAQWGMLRGGRLLGVASWQASRSASNHLWLATPPDAAEDDVHALLVHALQRMPSTRRPVSLDHFAGNFRQAILAAGFTERQTLIWMELKLS